MIFPKWLRYAIGAVLLVVLALLVNRLIRAVRSPDVTVSGDDVTHVNPPRPIFPRDTWEFADTTGQVERVRTGDRNTGGTAIRVDPPAADTTDTTRADPVRLVAEIEPARGLFPEFTGRRQRIQIRALSGGNRVTVVQQSRPLVALEKVPLIGASLRANFGAPAFGVPAGLTFLRVGPLHVGAGLDLWAARRGRILPVGWLSTSLYGPLSLGAGIGMAPAPRPTLSILIRFSR